MAWMRGAVVLAAALGAAGCGGGRAVKEPGVARPIDAGTDAKPDLATDFGPPEGEAPAGPCPAAGAPAPLGLVIDDFAEGGPLNGRQRTAAGFVVKEQFDATAGATFSPAPRVETACGAAHIKGRAADTGATFALVFSVPQAAGKPVDHFDASGTRGVTFRLALGAAGVSRLLTLQVNLAGSHWDYTKDVTVAGTRWQTVTVPWSELEAAPGAPPFSPALLNQLVFPFFAGEDVDLYIDDVAFAR